MQKLLWYLKETNMIFYFPTLVSFAVVLALMHRYRLSEDAINNVSYKSI